MRSRPTLEPLETISNVGMRLTYNLFDTLWRRDFAAEAREGGSRLTPFLATSLHSGIRSPGSPSSGATCVCTTARS